MYTLLLHMNNTQHKEISAFRQNHQTFAFTFECDHRNRNSYLHSNKVRVIKIIKIGIPILIQWYAFVNKSDIKFLTIIYWLYKCVLMNYLILLKASIVQFLRLHITSGDMDIYIIRLHDIIRSLSTFLNITRGHLRILVTAQHKNIELSTVVSDFFTRNFH